MDRIDRAVDPRRTLGGVVRDELRDVLERQRDGIKALDDRIVQVLADPLAFLDDGESLNLLVQSRVFHRNAGVKREHLDQPQIGF